MAIRNAAIVSSMLLAAAVTSAEEGWKFEVAPYLWAASLDGEITIRNRTADVDVGFGDILDKLELGFLGHFEASNDRYGVLADYVWLGLGGARDDLDADLDQTLLEAAGLYRVHPRLDLLGGIRYTRIDTQVARIVDPQFELDTEVDWVDPIVGGRLNLPLAEKWSLSLRGDIGGFGAGSDFSWNVAALVNWQVSSSIGLLGGYRALGQDYEEGDEVADHFAYDVRTHGPGLAVRFSF